MRLIPAIALVLLGSVAATPAYTQSPDLPDNLWDLLVTGPYESWEYTVRVRGHYNLVTTIYMNLSKGYRQHYVDHLFNDEWAKACNRSRSKCWKFKSESDGTESTTYSGHSSPEVPMVGDKPYLERCLQQGTALFQGQALVAYGCDSDKNETVYYVNPATGTLVFHTDKGACPRTVEYSDWVSIEVIRVPQQKKEKWRCSVGDEHHITVSLESLRLNVPYNSADFTEKWARSAVGR